MDGVLKSVSPSANSPSLMASNPCYNMNNYPRNSPPFPPAPSQAPLLPLPFPASTPHSYWPISRPRHQPLPPAKKPRHAAQSPKKPALPRATAPILVAAAPSKRRMAVTSEQEEDWTGSLNSVSPPPSSVPLPTSLLATAGRKAAKCAVEVAGGVDACATDELRRLLRL